MSKNLARENVPLSQFGVLVAQLESIGASASQQSPDPLLSFYLLSAIDEEPQESIFLWQRKCEDALYSLLKLGSRRPVRHLASVAMAKIISRGDSFRYTPERVSKDFFLMLREANLKELPDFVRQEALLMLEKALEGSGGSAASTAYTEAFRLITRIAIGDKSFVVRIAGARCLKVFASIGGPCLGVGELRIQLLIVSRDAFFEALGSLLALGMNLEAQVQLRGKGPFPPAKKLEGGLQRHLALPFTKVSGTRLKDVRIGITLSWVYFLQACILYILRVGVTDQMTEPTQRGFLVFLGKQLESSDVTPSMKIAALRTLSYTLKTLGEAALALRVLAEVDPTCVGGLISYVVTTLSASRDNVSFEKGSNLKIEFDSLNGQTTVLIALVSISPKLPLGYPARIGFFRPDI